MLLANKQAKLTAAMSDLFRDDITFTVGGGN